ncbi:MAG: hypothetical protein HZA46_24280 [Planctomycetales bacterium]|nr:hypothetical protein [Planctomycetales bacterium]
MSTQPYVDFDDYVDFHLNKTRQNIKSTELFTTLGWLATLDVGYLLAFVIADHWLIDGGFSFVPRVLMLFVVMGVTLGVLVWKVILPWSHQISALYAAKAIESADTHLKGNLLNYVDLQQAGVAASPAVAKAMEKRAAVELQKVDVEQAVDRRPLLRAAYVLLGVVVVACGYTVFSPKDVLTSMKRALLPMTSTHVATQTVISDVTPGDESVPARTQLTVEADIRGQVPDEVRILYTTADRQDVDQPVEMRRIDEGLPRFRGVISGENGRGVLQNLTYRVVAGDARSPEFRIDVVQPPSVKVDSVAYVHPAYMRLENKLASGGHIDGWEGTEVTLTATANMPLKSAKIEFSDTEQRPARAETESVTITDGTQLTAKWKLAFRADGTYPKFLRIDCTTPDGQSDPEPTLYTIKIRPDQPPEVALLSPTGDIKMPANGTVPLLYQATDPDFLLRWVTLHAEKDGQPLLVPPEHLLDDAEPRQSVRGSYDFALAPLNLKSGDLIQYWLEATDNRKPSPNSKRTPKQIIKIVDPVTPDEAKQQLAKEKERQQDQLTSADDPKKPDRQPMPGDDAEKPPRDNPPPKQPNGDPKADEPAERKDNEKPRDGDDAKPNEGDQQGTGGGSKSDPKNERGNKDGTPQKKADDDTALEKFINKQREREEAQKDEANKENEQAGDQKGKPGESNPASKKPGQPGAQKKDPGAEKKPGDDGQPSEDPADPGAKKSDDPGKSPPSKPGESDPASKKPGQPGAQKKDPGAEKKPGEDGQPSDDSADPGEKKSDDPGKSPPSKPGESDPASKKPGQPGAQKKDPGAEKKPGDDGQPSDGPADPGAKKSDDPGKSPPNKPGESDPAAKKPGQPGAQKKDPGAEKKPGDDGQPSDDPADPGAKKSDDPGKSPPSKPGESDPASKKAGQPGAQKKDPGAEKKPGDDGKPPDDPADQKPGDANSKTDKQKPGQGKPSDRKTEQKTAKPGDPPLDDKPSNDPAVKPEDRSEKPGKTPDDRNDDLKGKGRKDQKSPKSEGGEQGASKKADQGSKGDDKTGKGDKSEQPGDTDPASKKTGQPGSEKGQGSQKKPSDDGQPSDDAGDPSAKKSDQPGKPSASKPKPGEGESGEPGKDDADAKPSDDSKPGKSAKSKSGQPGKPGGKSEPSDGASSKSDQKSSDPNAKPGKPGESAGGKVGGGASGDASPPGQPGKKPGEGQKPNDADATSSTPDQPEDPKIAEQANLDYARKATNLVLQRLKEQLERGDVDQQLLDELGWTKEDAEKFAKRLEQQLNAPRDTTSPEAEARQKQFEELLKSLTVNSSTFRREGDAKRQRRTQQNETRRLTLPPEYRELGEAYTKGLSKAKAGEKAEKKK